MIVSTGVVLMFSAVLHAGDWTHWRGLHRDDMVDESSGWNDGRWQLAESWKINVGEGSTTPVVIGNRLYSMGWKNERDTVVCIETASGEIVWSQSYPSPRYGRFGVGDKGLYFGPTSSPEYDPETQCLYTLSCDGEVICWDTKQK